MESILIEKSITYKELFKLDNVRKVRVNFFDRIENFREFIYELRGEKDSLPKYATGTYDNGMINCYYPDNIDPNSPWFQSAIHAPSHELFHIMYLENVLNNNYDLRIVWYDEGMAQFMSGEKDYLSDEEKFINYLLKVKENTKEIPNMNELSHGTSFVNSNYNGYDLSYLSVRYLSEVLSKRDFISLMSNFNLIKQYGNDIVNNMFKYYFEKYNFRLECII